MTANDFNAECTKRSIDPEIALENANIIQALRIKDDGYVIEVLGTEF